MCGEPNRAQQDQTIPVCLSLHFQQCRGLVDRRARTVVTDAGAARAAEASNGRESSLSRHETVEFRFGGKEVSIFRSLLLKRRPPK